MRFSTDRSRASSSMNKLMSRPKFMRLRQPITSLSQSKKGRKPRSQPNLWAKKKCTWVSCLRLWRHSSVNRVKLKIMRSSFISLVGYQLKKLSGIWLNRVFWSNNIGRSKRMRRLREKGWSKNRFRRWWWRSWRKMSRKQPNKSIRNIKKRNIIKLKWKNIHRARWRLRWNESGSIWSRR